MLKIRVKLYATLLQVLPQAVLDRHPQPIRAGSPLDIELPDGSSLADVVDHLMLPREKVRVIFVNGRAKPLDYRLVSGDEIGIFPPVGGG